MTVIQEISSKHTAMQSSPFELGFCRHCGHVVPPELQEPFCCHGCLTAYALIKSFELNRFYEIVQDNRDGLQPVSRQRASYQLFDAPSFQKDFVEDTAAKSKTAHFYLDNMTCYACVWVCESVARRLDPEAQLVVNLATGEANLSFKNEPLSVFLQHFETLGYAVTPNRQYKLDARIDLARIGVSLFCLMNIMMLTFPEYLSPSTLSDQFRDLFRWISMALGTAAIFYSAWPLLRGAVFALYRRKLHLDLPIALALLSAHTYSVVHTIEGHPHVFYDTTTAVVSLLLVGRYIQKQALSRIAREQNHFLEGDFRLVRLQKQDQEESLEPLVDVKSGQIIRLLPGEVIPIDGKVLDAHIELHYGLLTGESQLVIARAGDGIKAGAVNGSEILHLQCEQDGVESYLLKLQAAALSLAQNRGQTLGQSEKMAKGFVALVLFAAFASLAIWWPSSPETAITRFVSVLLVACPCIFGFGAPLVIARAFQQGLQRGVLFRTQRAMERLALVQDFYFDKTGTLTEDESLLQDPEWSDTTLQAAAVSRVDVASLLRLLPGIAQHHVLDALSRWVDQNPIADLIPAAQSLASIRGVREYFGQGISFIWREHEIRIGRPGFCLGQGAGAEGTSGLSYLCIDGSVALSFKLEERLRPEAPGVIAALQALGKRCWMLSGDARGRAAKIGKAIGMDEKRISAQLTPEDKVVAINQAEFSVMVGNGINDTLAASKVAIGVATNNATSALREKADVVLLKAGLNPLLQAVKVSEAATAAMRRCFGFALGFNVIGLSLALTGLVTPVIAAIIMPISSLTIFAIARRWSPAL